MKGRVVKFTAKLELMLQLYAAMVFSFYSII